MASTIAKATRTEKKQSNPLLPLTVGAMAFTVGTQAEETANKTVGLIVVLALIGATVGLMFTNLGTIVENFTNINTGNPVIDTIVSAALVLLVGLAVVFGIVKLVQRASS